MIVNRITKTTLAIAVLAAGLLAADAAHAFRCGNKIVRDGMHEFEVVAICGEPTAVRHLGHTLRALDVRSRIWSGSTYYRFPGWNSFATELLVTEYIYNFGPRKLMRRLRFEGSELVDIETLGYGYHED